MFCHNRLVERADINNFFLLIDKRKQRLRRSLRWTQGIKKKLSILADQQRPRVWAQMRGEGGGEVYRVLGFFSSRPNWDPLPPPYP
jgi:hypothetical protein